MDNRRIATTLRKSARAILLSLGLLFLVFAALSGSGEYGGGLRGIIMNIPNALPWLILVVFTLVTFKWELVGGILVIIAGLTFALFFDFFKPGGYFGLFAITVPMVVLGSVLIAARLLARTPSLQERMEKQRKKMSKKAGKKADEEK